MYEKASDLWELSVSAKKQEKKHLIKCQVQIYQRSQFFYSYIHDIDQSLAVSV